MNNVLRLSTRESGTGQGNLITPAINGGLHQPLMQTKVYIFIT